MVEPSGRGAVRLIFALTNLDAIIEGLHAKRVAFDGPFASDEGYREVRVCDPDGTPVGLFEWTNPRSE